MRLGIRVDASTESGLGHIKRCLALAENLRTLGADLVFVTRDHGVDAGSLIKAAGFQARSLPRSSDLSSRRCAPQDVPLAAWVGATWEVDARQTCAAVETVDWMIVDHYGLDSRWHERVATTLGCRICIIDDLADRTLRGDLLVDHNLESDHRAKYALRVKERQWILGGPRFALLNPIYAMAPTCEVTETVTSIGIFMGGTDPTNASLTAVLACRKHARFEGQIEIATTRANPHLSELTFLCDQDAQLHLVVDLPELSGFFARHGMQVGAGGGASWERCRIGAPTVALVCAQNQARVIQELVARDIVRSPIAVTAEALGSEIATLLCDTEARLRLSSNSRELVDGRGAERVALALLSASITLRDATATDANFALTWRNDEATRRYSWDAAFISAPDHFAWWAASLLNADRRLLVAEIGRRPVGIFRLDIDDELARISIYLDPALHGLGLGPAILRAGQRWTLARLPAARQLVGEVHESNRASASAFAAAGFSQTAARQWTWELQA